jgi:dTDP-4-dehydrorhamnose reductase
MIKGMKIFITGASGRLGGALNRRYAARHEMLTPSRSVLDLAKPDEVAEIVRDLDFDLLINCAGMISPDECEGDPLGAMRVNAESPAVLAAECQRRGARMIQISTDYVFDGEGDSLLSEAAPAAPAVPVNAYGRSKLAGEQAVLAACSQVLVARVSWLFGPDRPSFPDQMLARAIAGQEVAAIADKWSVPTSTDDIAIWLEHLFIHRPAASGLLHVCNSGEATWHSYAETTLALAHEIGLIQDLPPVKPQRMEEFTGFLARRPRYTTMSNAALADLLGETPQSWESALRQSLAGRVTR